MKTTIVKISVFILLLSLTGAGCEKDEELYWEISPNSKSAIIQKEVDSIEFKFCLLNEEGKPATVFREGENFSFYFSVTNKRDEKLHFDPNFAYSNENGFCRVFHSDGEDYGKSYKLLQTLMLGAGAYPFKTDTTYVFEQLWVDNRSSVWYWGKGTYESTHREFLGKDNYYTGFKHRFRFARTHEEPSLLTDTLTFKINFKIQ